MAARFEGLALRASTTASFPDAKLHTESGFVDARTEGFTTLLNILYVLLAFSVWPFLNWLAATYTVTDRRLITRNGVLTRRGHDIPLNRISDVSYEHGVVDRILGCGTLVISDASTHGRVPLHDVPRVEDLHKRLSDLLFHGTGDRSKGLDDGS